MKTPTSKPAARKSTRRFHETQTAYMLARVTAEQIEADYNAACKAAGLVFERAQTDEEFESVNDAREALADQFGLYPAKDALRLAERAMVAWSCEQAKKVDPSKAAEIDETAKKSYLRPAFWARLVDMAARLRA